MGAPERGRRTEEDSSPAADDLTTLLRGWGQLRGNDNGWPTFDGRYANYPRFKREWVAYRETYHSVVNDDLDAKTLREKCVKGDALRMVSHLDDLGEMWDTLDTCYERPENYMEEALRPVLEFRKYKIFDSIPVREFYSILRAAIKGARSIGRLDLLINAQTVPRIMGKMPYTDWKEWSTRGGMDQGGPGDSLRGIRGAEMAGCPQRSRRGAPTLGARGAKEGKGDHQQSGSRKGTAGAQRSRQDSGCRERGDPAARLGEPAADLGAQEMPGSAADGV